MMYKRNQTARILAFTGPTFERDWSETVTIVRADKAWTGWWIVRFADGAKLCVHASRLMPSNA